MDNEMMKYSQNVGGGMQKQTCEGNGGGVLARVT